MISDKEFLELIQGLYEKTAKEDLSWQYFPRASANAGMQGREPYDIYWTQMPKSAVIELQYGTPSAEPDFINFTIARSLVGPVLDTRKVYEGDFGWEPLSDLFALIRRRALGWDDVFKSMREFLGNPTVPAVPQQGP